jgi:hypothetical protein
MLPYIFSFLAMACIPLALAAYGGHLAAMLLEEQKRRRALRIIYGLTILGILMAAFQQYFSYTKELKLEEVVKIGNQAIITMDTPTIFDSMSKGGCNQETIKQVLKMISEGKLRWIQAEGQANIVIPAPQVSGTGTATPGVPSRVRMDKTHLIILTGFLLAMFLGVLLVIIMCCFQRKGTGE